LLQQEEKEEMEDVFKQWLQKEQNARALSDNDAPRPPIGIDVSVHIVEPYENSTANTVMGLEWEQIDILTQSFVKADGSSAFVFNLVNVSTWVNSTWWDGDERDDNHMMKATRQGDMSTLNIWFKDLPDNYLGYARYPFNVNEALDGVVIDHEAAFGGNTTNHNEGDILVHEVGHWLGLYHSKMTNQSPIKDASNAYFPQLTSHSLCNMFFPFSLRKQYLHFGW